ncbi:hypothetical protein NMG60_11028524 [Bertholletia excelsa]
MAQGEGNNNTKKLIKIDVTADTACPWCLVGKKNLDNTIASSKDHYDFEISWHPYFVQPNAPKEGISKKEFYQNKFGPQYDEIMHRVSEVFRGLGLHYDMDGLTGCTLDSHRLIYFAGQQGPDKQHNLLEELMVGYFTQGKYIGDREFLLECARKVGVEGAAEFLEDPNNGVKEVMEKFEESSGSILGVPNYVINGKIRISGGQPPEIFQRAFQAAASA